MGGLRGGGPVVRRPIELSGAFGMAAGGGSKYALGLKGVYGFNREVAGGVLNLSDGERNAIFYGAAQRPPPPPPPRCCSCSCSCSCSFSCSCACACCARACCVCLAAPLWCRRPCPCSSCCRSCLPSGRWWWLARLVCTHDWSVVCCAQSPRTRRSCTIWTLGSKRCCRGTRIRSHP